MILDMNLYSSQIFWGFRLWSIRLLIRELRVLRNLLYSVHFLMMRPMKWLVENQFVRRIGEVTLVLGCEDSKTYFKSVDCVHSLGSVSSGSARETDRDDFYDVQYIERQGPDCWGRHSWWWDHTNSSLSNPTPTRRPHGYWLYPVNKRFIIIPQARLLAT